jgi:transcriptional antiterminator NusG
MNKRWYVVHVFSGMEKSVHKALMERIERAGLQTHFGQVLIPSEEVVEIKGGQKSITERRIFPGYVLIEMDLTDETWHLVKNTNRVTGFLGGAGNRPSPFLPKKSKKLCHKWKKV